MTGVMTTLIMLCLMMLTMTSSTNRVTATTYTYNITQSCTTPNNCLFPGNNASFINSTQSIECNNLDNILIIDSNFIYIPQPNNSSNNSTNNTLTNTPPLTLTSTIYYITFNDYCNISQLYLNSNISSNLIININTSSSSSNSSSNNNSSSSYIFNNLQLSNGSIIISNQSIIIQQQLVLLDDSEINVQGQDLEVQGNWFNVSSNSTVQLNGGNLNVTAGVSLIRGKIVNVTTATLSSDGGFDLSGGVLDALTIDIISSINNPLVLTNNAVLSCTEFVGQYEFFQVSGTSASDIDEMVLEDYQGATISTSSLIGATIQHLDASTLIITSNSSSSLVSIDSFTQPPISKTLFGNVTNVMFYSVQAAGQTVFENVEQVVVECSSDDTLFSEISIVSSDQPTLITMCNASVLNMTQPLGVQTSDAPLLTFLVNGGIVELHETGSALANAMFIVTNNSELYIKWAVDVTTGSLVVNDSSRLELFEDSYTLFDSIHATDSIINANPGATIDTNTTTGSVGDSLTCTNARLSLYPGSVVLATISLDSMSNLYVAEAEDDPDVSIEGQITLTNHSSITAYNHIRVSGNIRLNSNSTLYVSSGRRVRMDGLYVSSDSQIIIWDPLPSNSTGVINVLHGTSLNGSSIIVRFVRNTVVPNIFYPVIRSSESLDVCNFELLQVVGNYDDTKLSYKVGILDLGNGSVTLYIKFSHIIRPPFSTGPSNWQIGLIIFSVFIFACILFGIYRLRKRMIKRRKENDLITKPLIDKDDDPGSIN